MMNIQMSSINATQVDVPGVKTTTCVEDTSIPKKLESMSESVADSTTESRRILVAIPFTKLATPTPVTDPVESTVTARFSKMARLSY